MLINKDISIIIFMESLFLINLKYKADVIKQIDVITNSE